MYKNMKYIGGNMEKIRHILSLVILCLYVTSMRIRKVFLYFMLPAFFVLIIRYALIYLWQFRPISGYEWDFSITLYELFLGISAFISALAIISSGIIWFINKLNKNKTIIELCQPYIRIDNENTFPIKSKHEFNQILREAPLELLQVSSIYFIITFKSINNNACKVIYQSICKQRFGLLWILKTEKERVNDALSVRIKRAKSFFFESIQYEEFIFKDNDNTLNNQHRLTCHILLDPMLFLAYNKDISVSIKIQNTDKSETPWYKFSLDIENNSMNIIYKKLQKNIADADPEKWLEKWKKDLKQNNESKFDFYGRI